MFHFDFLLLTAIYLELNISIFVEGITIRKGILDYVVHCATI